MKTVIQIGAGPNGLIQAIKILEKHEGQIEFRIYDKRRSSDLNYLTSLVFLKKKAIEQLEPSVVEALLTPDPKTKRPMAYRVVDGFFKEDIIPLNLADLQRILIEYLKIRFGVLVEREYELVNLEKRGDEKHAIFRVPDGREFKEVSVRYDLCTLSVGSRVAKELSEKAKKNECNVNLNYKIFHQTPVIMAKFPLQRNYANVTSADERVNKTLMQVFPIDAEETFFGLMVTPDQVGLFATTSWENARAYKADKKMTVDRIYELLHLVERACPEITEAIINTEPTHVDVILAEKSLSNSIIADYAGMVTGDALNVSPWIWGNELNHALTYLLPVYLDSVDKMINATTHDDELCALHDYERESARKIHHSANTSFNMLVDPYGHTRTPEGYGVPLLPMIKPLMMPEGIDEHLIAQDESSGDAALIKPYLTWFNIKMSNLMSNVSPPSIAAPVQTPLPSSRF